MSIRAHLMNNRALLPSPDAFNEFFSTQLVRDEFLQAHHRAHEIDLNEAQLASALYALLQRLAEASSYQERKVIAFAFPLTRLTVLLVQYPDADTERVYRLALRIMELENRISNVGFLRESFITVFAEEKSGEDKIEALEPIVEQMIMGDGDKIINHDILTHAINNKIYSDYDKPSFFNNYHAFPILNHSPKVFVHEIFQQKMNPSDLIKEFNKNPNNDKLNPFELNEAVIKYQEYDKSTFFTYLNSQENRARPRRVTPNTVVIMTEVCWGTLGDFYAAFKLIAALKKRSPTTRVVWMIMESKRTIPQEKMPCDECHVYESWAELFSGPMSEMKLLFEAAIVVQFPTFHFFPKSDSILINAKRQMLGLKRILNVIEYDYVQIEKIASYDESQEVIKTGVGRDAVGIFIDDESLNRSEAMKILQAEPIAKSLFDNAPTAFDYDQHRVCYFGYRNKDGARSINKFQSDTFIQIVMAIHSKRRDPRQLDVVVPLTDYEHASISSEKFKLYAARQGFSEIRIAEQGKPAVVHLTGSSATSQCVICIHHYFPHPNHVFKALIAFAERRLVMCTGDQSLSDVLSRTGAIPAYQVMAWKENLYKEFCYVVANVCGLLSPLSKFMSIFAKPINSEDAIDSIATHAVICERQMQADMENVNEYLRTHKNLYKNLPPLLIQILQENVAVDAPESKVKSDKRTYPEFISNVLSMKS